jgi:hypothetical protein
MSPIVVSASGRNIPEKGKLLDTRIRGNIYESGTVIKNFGSVS